MRYAPAAVLCCPVFPTLNKTETTIKEVKRKNTSFLIAKGFKCQVSLKSIGREQISQKALFTLLKKKRETFIAFISIIVPLSKLTVPKEHNHYYIACSTAKERSKLIHLRYLCSSFSCPECSKPNARESIRSQKK